MSDALLLVIVVGVMVLALGVDVGALFGCCEAAGDDRNEQRLQVNRAGVQKGRRSRRGTARPEKEFWK